MSYAKSFQQAVDELIDVEAGFVDHPHDPGGATNYGISLRFLRTIDCCATYQTIKTLSRDRAVEIYHEHFWKKHRCDELPYSIADAHFVTIVNLPPREAVRILQRAVNRVDRQIVVDGLIGPKTIAAAHAVAAAHDVELRRRYLSELCSYYHRLAKARSQFESFIDGWFYRVATIFIKPDST